MHEKNINVKKRLFMTATERLFRANSNEYLSMDSKKNYGEIIYELSFKKAIETNPPIIADYKIITFNVTDQDIQKIHSDNKFIKVEKELENITAREFATAIALRKAIKKINIKNAISFHSSIKRAKNFQRQQEIIDQIYPEFEKLETFHVSGDMPVSKRASQMRLFAEEKGLMTNARCLTEGVDLPAIDCVCFTDPKRSKIDIVQAAGRALRLSKVMKKKIGYILVPLYVPENMDPEIASKGTSFEEIISVIGALSTQDSRIAEYLKGITMGRKPSVGNKVDGIISINTLTKINAEKFEKAILIKIWDKIARVNFVTYEEAKKYVSKYNFSGKREFKLHSTKNIFPKDIPRSPETVYNISWEGWGKFLGTGNRILAPGRDMNTNWRSYEEAKKYVLNQKYTSKRYFNLDSRKTSFPGDIPRRPDLVYKNFWKNWGDFLGTGYVSSSIGRSKKTNWRTYEEAKDFAQRLKFKSSREWALYAKNSKKFPADIPKGPDSNIKYKDKWEGWEIFLGNKNREE